MKPIGDIKGSGDFVVGGMLSIIIFGILNLTLFDNSVTGLYIIFWSTMVLCVYTGISLAIDVVKFFKGF